MSKRSQGFTLMEIMMVLAILGILVSIAFPIYNDHTTQSRRADAQAALSGFSSAMERHFTNNGTYLGAAAGGGNTGAPAVFPTQAPIDGSAKFYDLTIAAVTGSTYTLQATPIAGTAQEDDGIIRILSTGQKFWDKNDNGSVADANEDCWLKQC